MSLVSDLRYRTGYTVFNENTKDELFEEIGRVWVDIYC